MLKRRPNGSGTIRRRGRGWQGGIWLGGRRYWVRAPTRREVREKLMELALRHQQGQLSPPSRLTVGEWIEEWLRLGEGRLRPTSLHTYRQSLKPLILLLGRLRLSDAPPGRPRPGGAAAPGDPPGQLEKGFRHLRTCLREALALGLIAHDPLRNVPRPRRERREGKEWSLGDMQAFLVACYEDGRPLARMLGLMLLTGLRRGEAAGLQWGDIDLAAGNLTVRRAVAWESNSRWHIHSPKTKQSERTIALPWAALELLRGLERGSVYVFWSDRPPYPSLVSRAMAQLCRRAGVPRALPITSGTATPLRWRLAGSM